ncbi:MAG TPA: hypothetical protein VFA99_17200 [Acidobacteriaceae bacterium]|nr:hypothetical protein [Acidobacteriaceae bacterium]
MGCATAWPGTTLVTATFGKLAAVFNRPANTWENSRHPAMEGSALPGYRSWLLTVD